MKKILVFIILFLAFFISNVNVQAVTTDLPTLKFNGNKYSLLYSVKNADTKGFLNEYYKQREGYTNWTELVAVHHYPEVKSYVENANAVQKYLAEKNCNPNLIVDEKKDAAIIDFFMIHDTNSHVILEYNVFKYEKDVQSGTIAFQYVQRFYFNNGLEAEMMKRDLQKSRKKYVKKVLNTNLPKLIVCDVENGVYVTNNPVKQQKNIVTQTIEDNSAELKQDNYSRADYYPCDEFFKSELKSNIEDEKSKDKNDEINVNKKHDEIKDDVEKNKNENIESFSKSDYYPCDAFFDNLD